MVLAQTVGTHALRKENIDRAVTGFAKQMYKFKQLCLISKSNSWKETFWKKDPTVLTALGTRSIKGVSRLANFPHIEPSFSEHSKRHQKYAAEGTISWEDVKTDEIDVLAETLSSIAQAIAKAVDDEIYAQLIADSDIGTVVIAGGDEWDSATLANQNPIDNILECIETIDTYFYDVQENGYLLLNAKNHRSLIQNSKVINNPSFKTADVVSNGKVGQVCGLTIVKSQSVPADEALVLKGKTAATWKSVQDLTTETIYDKLTKYTIRAVEVGVTQVRNPRAICRMTGMDA